ncbi:MAG TPA: response regulator [Methylomirabilota bacterium]|nr:response regulator [Methylomirabilota bacterium]
MSEPRILHVEDNPQDALLISKLLRDGGVVANFHRVSDRQAFSHALARESFDLILCDFSLPGFNGLDALEIAKAKAPELPFVFVSGMIGEELAVESLKRGASDYVLKDRLGRLATAIKRALTDAQVRRNELLTKRRLEEQSLLLQHASDAILACSPELCVTFANAAAVNAYTAKGEAMVGRSLHEIFAGSDPAVAVVWEAVCKEGVWSGVVKRAVAGESRIFQSRWTLLRGQSGSPMKALISETDVTGEKQLEESFVRAQRMECIGTLAAGVAHDVNSSLTPILLGLDLLGANAGESETSRLVEIMRHSAEHCSHLVNQIVTFARGRKESFGPVSLAELAPNLLRVLQQVFPKSIKVVHDIPADLPPVMGDATRLHQALMNLCINARDAMPRGGLLTLKATRATNPDTGQALAVIHVKDTGTGIAPESQGRLFEPFFTTKAEVGGTGLGLPLVRQIVKEHQGAIRFTSAPGVGTTFILELPACDGVKELEAPHDLQAPLGGSGELALVVEDELSLAEMMTRVLSDAGYRVQVAHDGASGLSAFFQQQHELALVIANCSLRFLDGTRMLAIIREARPELPTILCTGFSVEAEGTARPGMHILEKPFTAARLLQLTAAALGRPG